MNVIEKRSLSLKDSWRSALNLAKKIGGTPIGKKLAAKWQGKFALAMVSTVGLSAPAYAINFYNTYQPGISLEQIEGIELATGILSKYIQDDININVHFEMTATELPFFVIGESTPRLQIMDYDQLKLGLEDDASDGNYTLNFPDSPLGDNYYKRRLTDGSYDDESSEILTTSANNKAIGNDISPTDPNLDVYVSLNSNNYIEWYYGHDSNIPDDKFDFVGVVLHELGHGLGLASGLDFIGGNIFENHGKNLATSWDLFRYTEESYNQGAIDFALGGNPYFSIDGGQNPFSVDPEEEAHLSLGNPFSSSHWKYSDNPLGVMHPLLSRGEQIDLTENDLMSLDYMGYSVEHNEVIDLNQLKLDAQGRASTAIIQDRQSEIDDLIDHNDSLNLPYSGWWMQGESNNQNQKFNRTGFIKNIVDTELFNPEKRYTFSHASDPSDSVQPTSQSVPEPNTAKGLFVLVGVIGLVKLFKNDQD